ncbi:PhoH family protein [Sulfitobacter sp. R18_1]|uniref:PhoH family protein n=1 Tax=Sulfitobacter sp. R18_1 TaxID=2821104 RepID=UPI001ADCCF5C|nr:PhoH family protein [Sulfitobacter sp. R18_1]MBO9428547.1 PhoH family protein [Sulfitobacter sp. R18_1]
MGKASRKKQKVNLKVVGNRDADNYFEQQVSAGNYGKSTPSGRQFKKNLEARTENQELAMNMLRSKTFSYISGTWGTGKTFLAVAIGIELFKAGIVKKMVFTRPAVEAGEKIGFLPGDMKEKVDPYMQPLYDACLERMSGKELDGHMREKRIEICPVGFLRGRTLAGAYIVVDEAQNCTYTQLKMIYTRIGMGSKMVFTGDESQSDIPDSGYVEMLRRLKLLDGDAPNGHGLVQMTGKDIVRHPLLAETAHLL